MAMGTRARDAFGRLLWAARLHWLTGWWDAGTDQRASKQAHRYQKGGGSCDWIAPFGAAPSSPPPPPQPRHPAADLPGDRPVVFCAHSAETAYLSPRICAFVLESGRVPIDPFMSYGYFLSGLVDKQLVRQANNSLLERSDELWAFGDVSDGVAVEIGRALASGKTVRRYSLDHYGEAIAPLV